MAKKSKVKNAVETTATAIKPAPYNPRKISKDALAGLKQSLTIFGDLAGLVWNRGTGNIICGHQRRVALKHADLAAVQWGEKYAVELGEPGKRFKSIERDGWLTSADGARFRVREVEWPLPFEKAANLAANNPHVQGEFTDDVDELLAEIRIEIPTLSLADLRLDLLAEIAKTAASTTAVEINERFEVLVTCPDEAAQAALLERLTGEGYECKAQLS